MIHITGTVSEIRGIYIIETTRARVEVEGSLDRSRYIFSNGILTF